MILGNHFHLYETESFVKVLSLKLNNNSLVAYVFPRQTFYCLMKYIVIEQKSIRDKNSKMLISDELTNQYKWAYLIFPNFQGISFIVYFTLFLPINFLFRTLGGFATMIGLRVSLLTKAPPKEGGRFRKSGFCKDENKRTTNCASPRIQP